MGSQLTNLIFAILTDVNWRQHFDNHQTVMQSIKINLNRLHNGLVIVEMLPPIDVSQYGKDQVRELAAHCRSIMEQKIAELDKEVAEREAAGKV